MFNKASNFQNSTISTGKGSCCIVDIGDCDIGFICDVAAIPTPTPLTETTGIMERSAPRTTPGGCCKVIFAT